MLLVKDSLKFCPRVFFCSALPHLSGKLYGQSLYSFHNHLP